MERKYGDSLRTFRRSCQRENNAVFSAAGVKTLAALCTAVFLPANLKIPCEALPCAVPGRIWTNKERDVVRNLRLMENIGCAGND